MLSDSALAGICADTYKPSVVWDWLYVGDCWVAVRKIDDVNIVAFRGSDGFIDWLHDFEALPLATPDLGMVETGFMAGVRDMAELVLTRIGESPWRCTGHSLGAAHAFLFSGLAVLAGQPPQDIVTFGSPKPGWQNLVDILVPVPIRSYKNRSDIVTDCPALPEYMHPRRQISIDVVPDIKWGIGPGSSLDPDHSINLYQQGAPNA